MKKRVSKGVQTDFQHKETTFTSIYGKHREAIIFWCRLN